MLTLIAKALKKTNNVKRSSYIWNAINATMSAAQSPVILMVMTRTNGIYDAGIFSIAFAVAYLMLHVGQYGLRRFQSSDITEKYTFGEYHGVRIMTGVAMLLASGAYCVYGLLFKDYSASKFTVIFLICGLKCIQAYADVYHGRLQQVGRLDIAAKASSVRYVIEMAVYAGMLIITQDLLISTAVCLAISVITLLVTTVNVSRGFCTLRPSFEAMKMKLLFFNGFPLFVSLFLNVYISNVPKYAIDAYLTEEIQAIYNLIFMPAFMVQLIAHFIFNPIITTCAELWLAGEYSKFRKLVNLIKKQCLLVLGLAILGLAIAFTIGIPVLSLIFGVDLSDYKAELCVIMAGGGALAYATFFSTVITIIRAQFSLLICYGATALAAKGLSGIVVQNHGIMGAAAIYSVLMGILAVVLLIITVIKLRTQGRNLTTPPEFLCF